MVEISSASKLNAKSLIVIQVAPLMNVFVSFFNQSKINNNKQVFSSTSPFVTELLCFDII